jgi:iron complex outermembrane receptor protein
VRSLQREAVSTKFLPSANFAYDITDNLRLRLAAAKVIARPSFSELSSVSDASSAKSGTLIIFNAGDPNLKPTTATQFDASLEYYISSQSVNSAAVFYKDIKGVVTVVSSRAVIAGQNFTIERPENGASAKVFGVEVAGKYLFDNGFGIQANMTYNRSGVTLRGVKGKPDGAIPFSANAKPFCETDRFDARISCSHAAEFTAGISGLIVGQPESEREYHELSAGIGYEIIPGIKEFAEGFNLLNKATRR